ncbi:hypothetical protein [Rhodoferax bucti]|uniref:hypothetical protein n=1 Tax=Rhodoferax bucti TaxID=2576305 RepID=UPI001107AD3F|nr:hypothetical protein [Rhodoferax bucti]
MVNSTKATSQERRATYIGSLQREKTGLKCDCVCPACGGRLQAINAGNPIPTVPAGKTKRPHFRHDVGQQYESCLIKMSQIVALQLLLQEKAIYLPPQTVSFPVVGASGQIYTGTSHCDGLTMEVAAREWIDEQEAKIITVRVRQTGCCLCLKNAVSKAWEQKSSSVRMVSYGHWRR